ncbi:hypothetical protein CAPTEDRAFT_71093, partial [Capitella teleta]
MNEDLTTLSEWCTANSLKINVSKCNCMLFGEKRGAQSGGAVKMNNAEVHRVTEFKLLGIIIDDKLKWNHHIDYVSRKISSGLYAMRRVKNYVPCSALLKMYFTLVHAHLSYGNVVW